MRHKVFLYTVIFFAFVICTSCSDNSPSVASIQAVTIMEFKDEVSLPSVRLALFAEASSDVQRAKKLRVVSRETGLSWNCTDLIKFSEGNKKNWTGSSSIVPAENEMIPEGAYSVIYTDCADAVWEGAFSVRYDRELLTKKAREFPECIKVSKSEKAAVYDENGVLKYFGEKKKTWTTIEKVRADIKDAASFRICYYLSGENIMILMPEYGISDKKSE